MRDAMTDDEFWAHVAENLAGPLFIEAADLMDDEPPSSIDAGPCPECGEVGACAYDSEGRALIHVTPDEDEDSPARQRP